MQKVKKGDSVKILLGKDNGKTGGVERVQAKEGKVYVSGINIVKRAVRKQGNPPAGGEGGIIDLIKPVDLSNVAVICPKCKKPTRVGFKFEGDQKVRFCKKCQGVIQ